MMRSLKNNDSIENSLHQQISKMNEGWVDVGVSNITRSMDCRLHSINYYEAISVW